MKWSALGLGLAMSLGLAGGAHAATASIDFTGDAPVAQGLTLVNNSAGSDGVVTIVKRGGKNVAQTGGTDAARNLYLKLDPSFLAENPKSVFVTVEYWDEGKGGFSLEFDGQDDALQTRAPNPRTKFDAQRFTSQTWHLVGFKLKGGQTGGADIRINDIDDPEFIAKITVSTEDPQAVTFPYAATKITIDGKADAAEWDGAAKIVLDRPELDGVGGSPNWKGAENFSGTYSFKYDENALYVLGQVKDTTPRLNTTEDGVAYWNGDGVEIFLGLDETDPERMACAEGTDFQVGVGLGKTPGWAILAPAGSSLDPIGDNIKFGPDAADGYTFELAIPWNRLDASAKVTPGQKIGFYMFANDSSVDPSAQEIALGPAGRTGPSCNPSVWIRSTLGPKP